MNNIVYSNGEIEIEVSIEKDIAMIFDVNRPAIVKHIGNIYKTDKLLEKSTCSILEQVAFERFVSLEKEHSLKSIEISA